MNFQDIKNGAVEGFCLIKTCEKKMTQRGVPFLDLTLADKSGEIDAKLWDYKEGVMPEFEPNMLVKVRGTISVYNGNDQMRVERMRKAVPGDNVDVTDYVPSAGYNGEWMLEQIETLVNGFKSEELRALTMTIIDEYREKMLYWPAAFKLHHAVRGGLLFHTLSIVRLAQSVSKIYPFVNEELLLTGAILHDVAKITEFEAPETGIASGYTVRGTLIGHLAQGAMIVDSAAKKLGISEETAMLVEHMLLSHHGEPEFGAAVKPAFLEAELLSELDLMDARIYEVHQALDTTPVGEFSPRQWALDNRKFYNHGLGSNDEVKLEF